MNYKIIGMSDFNTEELQILSVDINEVHYGWLNFSLRVGEQEFETCFSETHDPLLELKQWLESLLAGDYHEFKYDTENEVIIWCYTPLNEAIGKFEVNDAYAKNKEPNFIVATVDLKQIIKEIYGAFLKFFSSEKYKPEYWEIEYLWERIATITHTTYEVVLSNLLELDPITLKQLFFKANPTYYISYPSETSEGEGINFFVDDVTNGTIEQGSTHFSIKKPIEWNIPEDYVQWTSTQKIEFLEECLSVNVNGYKGKKPGEFRSSILDALLSD